MKKQYINPRTEIVIVRLQNSVLDSIGQGDYSTVATDMSANEQELEWDEDATSNHLRNINLWDE